MGEVAPGHEVTMVYPEPSGPPTPTPQVARDGLLTAPRQLAAWALVGYTGLYLVFAFFDWVLPDGGTFGRRSAGAGFTALVELALPLIAVLLATGAGLAPVVGAAKSITALALGEYTVAVVFGAIAWLSGLGSIGGDSANAAFDAMAYVLLGIGRLGLVALAGLVVYRAWLRLGGTLPARR